MIHLVINAHELLWHLQSQVEEAVKSSGLEVTDELVDALFVGAIDSAETVYQHIDSDRVLNLLQLDDIDAAHQRGDFQSTYAGDFYSQLIELCNEDNQTLKRLANFGVEFTVGLVRLIVISIMTNAATRSLIARLTSSSGLPTGRDTPALLLTLKRVSNETDVIVTVELDKSLTNP